ncbi:MAG TPA: PLP-dependent aminotransferase family protein [Methylomusa anaerophila]|uniref:2-aminoadipate transaminase n=1 Tax=Methylomusa anaerophila TaxID=1930071 RepID=A0A348AG38_9FIRM|nr:PLP-dependent aminotransferase family protein [Methylomusa anaerophila]BBB90036.1 2-aminoadipate transaminase [Methylomusa anaerophila]HML88236.1 PLP-dependent aminotransferase family protein [Methylomusa anaerophila]
MDISKIIGGIRLDPAATIPLYIQIANAVAAKIQENILPPNTKLPPERELAELLKVSRTTAINAYHQLERQKMVRTRIGSGTYIAELSSHSVPKADIPWHQLFSPHLQTPLSSIIKELVSTVVSSDSISLSAGMPDPALYPLDAFHDLFNLTIKNLDSTDFGHIPTEGYFPLRQELARYLNQKNIFSQPDDILVSTGSQQALYLLTKVLLAPGDYVIVESPTYLGAIQMFQSAGARILTLPAAGRFPLSLMEDYLIRYRPKLLYILPTFQNPNGRLIPLNERQEILSLASRHRLAIIEDDPYGELYYGEAPPPSLKALDHYGGVIYLSTFSKILFPGLRTGWIAAPAAVINRVALEKQYMDLHSNNISQWLLTNFLGHNLLESHLKLVRREYKKRRDSAARALRRHLETLISFSVPGGGFYLWCHLENRITSRQLLHEVTKENVSFVPGEAFYADPLGEKEFRLCFVTHREELLQEGVKRLAQALHALMKNTVASQTNRPNSIRPII